MPVGYINAADLRVARDQLGDLEDRPNSSHQAVIQVTCAPSLQPELDEYCEQQDLTISKFLKSIRMRLCHT